MGTLFVIIIIGIIIYIIIDYYRIIDNKKVENYSLTKHGERQDESINIEDYYKGYEFIATLWAYTSLAALNHHKVKIHNVKRSELPHFTDDSGRNGIWLGFVNEDYDKPTTNEELRTLEFLKKFRTTYESDLFDDQKYKIISRLFEEYNDLPSPLHATDWYLWDLKEIQGISASIAEVLYFEGYKSKQDVERASDEELLNITGIGPGRLKQLRTYFLKDRVSPSFQIEVDAFNKTKFSELSPSSNERNKKRIIEPTEIVISRAHKIYLPKLRYERPADPTESVKQDWDKYNQIVKNAQLYYNSKRYQKAKEEWLKIYKWYHRDKIYYNNLLKTYRKLIEDAIKRKICNDALMLLNELFEKCPSYSNTDINNYNTVISRLNKTNQHTKLPLKELLVSDESDFYIDSEVIIPISRIKKPNNCNFEFPNGTSEITLKSQSNFLSESPTHIEFNDNTITYKVNNFVTGLQTNAYRFRESSNQKYFLAVSRELKMHLYNWSFELLGTFDATNYPEQSSHLMCIDLSSDLSCFLFTIVDTAFLLDSKMNLISTWHVPPKDGFERMASFMQPKEENRLANEYLEVLELHNKPSKEEVKKAFRKLILKSHPDRNPNNPEAEERTKSLIEAYEFLSGEDVLSAFEISEKDKYNWVTSGRKTKLELDGIQLEMTIYGMGEDWIYGTGISDDGSRIFLGCYSGKIYQINKNRMAEKIYFIPTDILGENEIANPVLFVTEFNRRIYILTRWYLYILKDDKLVRYVKNEKGNYRNNERRNYKLFQNGFIHQDKKQITLFDIDGNRKGMISFKLPILQVCYKNNILLVESTTEAFSFKLNYN